MEEIGVARRISLLRSLNLGAGFQNHTYRRPLADIQDKGREGWHSSFKNCYIDCDGERMLDQPKRHIQKGYFSDIECLTGPMFFG
jgi:hypothetical protein